MTDQFKNEWNAGYEKGRDDYCCNGNCNQGRDCPLRKVKPVAWYNADDSSLSFKNHGGGWQPLYTHPVKELTDEEIREFMAEMPHLTERKDLLMFARAILRKASEK